MRWLGTTGAAVAVLGITPLCAAAQLQATRPALEDQLVRLEAAVVHKDSSAKARSRIRSQAGVVRARLLDGDFQPGDRILLQVEASGLAVERGRERPVEEQLTDTFTVGTDREVILPVIGAVSLRGVLRAELQPHLTKEIGRYIREPAVQARALIRVSVVGGVTRPGYYAVAADAVLSDVLMVAGGPAGEARLRGLRIERSGERLWEGAALQQALADGRTLDAMSIRAGDEFVVPLQSRGSVYTGVRTVAVILSIPITIYTLTRIF